MSRMAADVDLMLDDLGELVRVESPSSDLAALAASARTLADLVARRLGAPAELISGPTGPHVSWRAGDPRILVVGHHDTVFPLGTLARRPFAVDGGRATGPGVFDMKGGIVQAIHAIASLADPSGVELLITADEEIGSPGSRGLIEQRARACAAVLVLEPSADGGALKIGRKGTGTFDVVVRGRAAHAGLEPEKGVNALVEAAQQVLDIATFARPDLGTTVSPTMATAGTADNVIPAHAHVKVDVRVTNGDEARRIDAAMRSLVARHPAASIEVTGGLNRPPMHPDAAEELFAIAVDVAREHALAPVQGVVVGGGSDGNFTAAIGAPTLDGLGAVGGGAHADDEHVLVDTMPGRVSLLAGIITRLQAG